MDEKIENNVKPVEETEIEVDVQPEEPTQESNLKTIVYAVKLRESEIKGVKTKAETEFNLRVSNKLAQSDVYLVMFVKGFENDMHRFENEFLKDIYEYEEVSEEEIESGFEVVGEGEIEDDNEEIDELEGIYEDYGIDPDEGGIQRIGKKGGKEERNCPACAADSKKPIKDQELIMEEKEQKISDNVKKIVDEAIVEVKNKGEAPTIENIMAMLKKKECEEIAKQEKEIRKYLSDMNFPKEKEIKTPEGFSDKVSTKDSEYSIHKKVGDAWHKVFDCKDLDDAIESLDVLRENIPDREYKIEKKTSK